MAQSSIQVVLNTTDYLENAPRPTGGGGHKDFFSGRNNAFITHKSTLINSVTHIGEQLRANPYSPIGYTKVRLIKDAWAKSHRPGGALFTERQHCRIVGGLHRGEMVVEVDGNNLGALLQAMNEAELEEIKRLNKDGELVPATSQKRSEVGAIDSISLLSQEDKCSLSLSEMLDWVRNRHECLYVELFEIPPSNYAGLSIGRARLFESFRRRLESITGLQVGRVAINNSNLLIMRIDNGAPTSISFESTIPRDTGYEPCNDLAVYTDLVRFLTSHPLVKYVTVSPFVLSLTPAFQINQTESATVPIRDGDDYPIIGVIDGGISSIYDQWKVGSWDYIVPGDRDEYHGTFISGLLVQGKELNPTICSEAEGCRLVDICLLPKHDRLDNYYKSMAIFCDELDSAVRDAVNQYGVRVFNLSMNSELISRTYKDYSLFAKKLDDLSLELDIIFVISAGNLTKVPHRALWSTNPSDNIAEILSRKDDIAMEPAESIRNISICALNPDMFGLANYSRKGKASELATKPDFVYQSGSGQNILGIGQGLYSVNAEGKITSDSGTSYSAPIVAKTIASLDKAIGGRAPRETLLALMYHNAVVPDSFKDKGYQSLLEEMIGYGKSIDTAEMLAEDSHSISLVFHARIRKGEILSFPFAWPHSLTTNGKCRGYVKLTLVSTPAVDHSFGSECVRENVSAYLRRDTTNGKRNITELLYKDSAADENENRYEWELVEEEHKWNPIKIYEKKLSRLTTTGQFYLELEYLSRTSQQISHEGVPFTAILTISDNKGEAPVFDEMRNNVISQGVQIADIQTAARVTPRV